MSEKSRIQDSARHHATSLADTLEQMLEEHDEMMTLAGRHRDALAHSDGAAIEDISHRRGLTLDRIAALERSRRIHTESLRDALGNRTEAGLPELAELTGDEQTAERVLRATSELRKLMKALSREHRIIRASTLTLCTHLEGVMRHAMRAVADTGTYTNRGLMNATGAQASRVDVAR